MKDITGRYDLLEVQNKYETILKDTLTPDMLNNADNPISKLIYYNDLNSVKQKISDWVASRLTARHVFVPDWTDLIRVYDYVKIDAHVFGIMNGIKQKVEGKEFCVYDANGEINQELTKHLQSSWFDKYSSYFIESFFYPYSLVELGEYVNGKFNDIKMIKREYVVPQYRSVKLFLYGNSVPKYVQHFPQTGVKMELVDPGTYMLDYFDGHERINDYIFMECPLHDLGLFDMAAPHALGKMGSLAYFLDYLQKFVVPFRHGQTDINDNNRRTNMDNMMKAWGAAGYAVTDLDDAINVIEQGGSATAPFETLFTYSNNEISKAFASAVGIFDEKNFVGSAEAGERMLDAIVASYCKKFEYNVNDELFPRLAQRDKRYAGKTFGYVAKEVIPYMQRIDAIVKLAAHFKLDPEEVSEKTDFTIEEKEIPLQLQNNNPKEDKEEPEPKKLKPTKEMIENVSRALEYVKIKKLPISKDIKTLAEKIKNNMALNYMNLVTISEQQETDKSYSESMESVIFDLCGGKEGVELAKSNL